MERLVGEHHERALSALRGHVHAVTESGHPAMMTLRAAPGTGKSRLLLELYRELVASQPSRRYWPEPDASWDGYPPSPAPEPNARMDFFWWGLTCAEASHGRPLQVLADHITQLTTHAELMVSRQALFGQMAGQARDHLVDVGTGLVSDSIPLASTGVAIGRTVLALWRSGRRAADIRGQLGAGTTLDALDAERTDIVEQARATVELLGREIPVVIAIDDAHLADRSLALLVEHVMATRTRVAIVVATQPTDGSSEFDTLVTDPDRCRGLELAPLEPDETIRLLESVAPASPRDVVLAIARKAAGNPRSALTLLSLLPVADGAIRADVEDVNDLPDGYAEQLGRIWDRLLPGDVKALLSAGAEIDRDGEGFLTGAILEAIERVRPGASAPEAIERAVDPFGWLSVRGQLARYRQPQQRRVAGERSPFVRRERERLHHAVAEILADLARRRELARLPLGPRRIALRTVVTMAEEGLSPDTQIAAESAFELAHLEQQMGRDEDALSLMRRAIAWVDTRGVPAANLVNLRSSLITPLTALHRYDEVATLSAELAADPDATPQLRRAMGLAELVARVRRQDAVHASDLAALASLADEEDRHNPSSQTALAARTSLAFFSNRVGEHEAALEHYVAVADRLSAATDDQDEVAETRALVNVAATRRYLDGLAAALADLDRIETWSEAALATVRLGRLRIIQAAVSDGENTPELRDALARAIGDAIQSLGASHTVVRGTLNMLGNQLLDAGDCAGAVEVYESHPAPLDAPDVDQLDLSAAFNHASGLIRLDRAAQAEAILRSVVRVATERLGPAHELTSTAVAHHVHVLLLLRDPNGASHTLGGWMLGVGMADEWRAGAHATLARVNGMVIQGGHPAAAVATLLEPARRFAFSEGDIVAATYLGQWLGELLANAREPAAARVQFAESGRLARQLGHTETAIACAFGRAQTWRMEGDLDEARRLLAALREESSRALPPDHPLVGAIAAVASDL